MTKLVALILLGVTAIGLIAGIATQITSISDLASELADIDLEDLDTETTGLDDINLVNLLPLLQIFMGQAITLDKIELPKATQQEIADLNLTLPPGWEIAKDEAGDNKIYSTSNSTVVMVSDDDGNFAVISKSTEADAAGAQEFLSDTINQQAYLLELSGFEVNAYTTVMTNGQQAHAIDVEQSDLVIEIRGWVSGTDVYIINMTSSVDALAVSEQIFESIE